MALGNEIYIEEKQNFEIYSSAVAKISNLYM